ncbi:uncharacterized protein LOC142180399 [Nicotiana tabacum]|uniref:Uncharacterized protein LOC142180399 n=1 Tax=Nicotiana tabacum TaxID=4097 RepID=A0AC58UGV9_TOBAC
MGNYNAVLHVDDILNGAEIKEQEIRDFTDFLFEIGLTQLKTEEYNAADVRISTIRSNLQEAHEQMRLPGHDPTLFNREKSLKADLEKWVKIDEMIDQQKSRVKWLKLVNSNSPYFFACTKNKSAINQLKTLVTIYGEQKMISRRGPEILQTVSWHSSTPIANSKILSFSNGPKLNRNQQLQLINPITREEVYIAIKNINDMKAQEWMVSMHTFSKKAWHVIGNEVVDIILNIFGTGVMYKQVNCTSITLIPKVKNPSSVKQYRPISCCSVT